MVDPISNKKYSPTSIVGKALEKRGSEPFKSDDTTSPNGARITLKLDASKNVLSVAAMDAIDKSVVESKIIPLVKEREQIRASINRIGDDKSLSEEEIKKSADLKYQEIESIDKKLAEFRGTTAIQYFMMMYTESGDLR